MYVAVHVVDAPGANVVVGQATADMFAGRLGAVCTSLTLTLVSVTLPMLVTLNVNGTC